MKEKSLHAQLTQSLMTKSNVASILRCLGRARVGFLGAVVDNDKRLESCHPARDGLMKVHV